MQGREGRLVSGDALGSLSLRLPFRWSPAWYPLALLLSLVCGGWRSLAGRPPGGLSEILSVTCLLKSPAPCCGSVKLFKVSPDIRGLVRRDPQARVEKSLEGCFRASMLADVGGGPGRCPLGGCPGACGQTGWMTSPVLFLLWCPESAGPRKDLIVMALVPAGPPMAS